MKRGERILYCINDIIGAIKEHNPRQLMLFYECIRVYKSEVNTTSKAEGNEQFESIEQGCYGLPLKKIKVAIGVDKISESKLESLIDETIKTIKIKGVTMSIFNSIYVSRNFKDEVMVYFELSDTFKTRVLENIDGEYSILDLEVLTNLRGKYAQKFYEIFVMRKGLRFYKMRIEDFKEYMGLSENFRMTNLDGAVIKPALKELYENDINITLNKIREGRKITHIMFCYGESKDIEEKEDELPF